MTEYKLAREIKNVFRYAISEDKIYIVGKNNFRVLKNNELIFSIETEDIFQGIHESLKSCLLPYTNSYKTGLYSKSNNGLHIIEGIIGVALDENGDCFFGNKSKESNKFCKYNLVTNEEVWSINSRLFNFYQNRNSIFGMLQGDKTKLYNFSKETGQAKWGYDFSEIGALSFSLIIGEKDNVLFVPIKIGKNECQIIGLNANSGKLVFQSSKEIEGNKIEFDKLPMIHNWSFVDNNRIIGICDCWIYIVNILTSQITLLNKDRYLSDHDIRELNSSYRVSENEENLFLIGHQKMKYDIENFIPAAFIIALNKKTFDIVWKYSVKNPSEAPRLIGDKLFQRMSDDKLIILKKASS